MLQEKAVETKRNEEQKWVMPLTNNAAVILISLMLAGGAASGHRRRYHWALDPSYVGATREQK